MRAFYASYTPRGLASGLAATDSVLGERPALFTAELLTALRQDAAARAAARGEIAGLDADPFLAAQDPCDAYVVGAATPRPGTAAIRVPVFPVCGGKRASEPAVEAEVIPERNTWRFANFYYGTQAGDLLTQLKRLHS